MHEESIQDGAGNELPPLSNRGAMVPTAGQAMQQVKTGYTTAIAVQQPRELTVVQKRFLEEARLMGEAAYYGWAAGKDRIEGPSQALAYAVARCWGNCAVDQSAIEETPDAWIFTSVFVDLETGFTLTRKFRQSKRWTVHGKLDAERKDDVRFQIGQTKGDRNVILKAIPRWLVDHGMEEAKKGVREKLEKFIVKNGLSAAIDYALKELAKSGVSDEQVCDKFSVAKASGLTVDQLVIIAGDIKAIQAGQEYPDALYPSTEASDIAGQLTKPKGGKKQPEAPPSPEPADEDETHLFNEYMDQVNQSEVAKEIQDWIKQANASAMTADHKHKVQSRGEVRLAELGGKGKKKELFDGAPQ